MSNKHSHAAVLSYYEARGLMDFPNPYSSRSSKSKGKSRARKAARPMGVYSFDSRISSPAQLEASSEVPSAIAGINQIKRHRATPSVVTEIFAPEHPDSPSRESDASVESSKYSESSERCTSRTSLSLYGPLTSPGTGRQGSTSVNTPWICLTGSNFFAKCWKIRYRKPVETRIRNTCQLNRQILGMMRIHMMKSVLSKL